jgi:hypothetical protein
MHGQWDMRLWTRVFQEPVDRKMPVDRLPPRNTGRDRGLLKEARVLQGWYWGRLVQLRPHCRQQHQEGEPVRSGPSGRALFFGQSDNFPSASDPCRGLGVAGGGPVPANCLAQGPGRGDRRYPDAASRPRRRQSGAPTGDGEDLHRWRGDPASLGPRLLRDDRLLQTPNVA